MHRFNPTGAQLRIIWNHVRWLAECHMHPSEANRQQLAKDERTFTKYERMANQKPLSLSNPSKLVNKPRSRR